MSDTAEAMRADRPDHAPRQDATLIAPRVVTFATQWGSYYAGESAAFSEIDAAALVELGVATEGGTPGEPITPRPDAPSGGVMVAGLEFPPRRFPADPQHLDIPQTYDPMVRHQLERAARDRAAGKPGMAAQEDLERAMASQVALRDRRDRREPPLTDPA
jgi:hypothetical protein